MGLIERHYDLVVVMMVGVIVGHVIYLDMLRKR